MTGSMHAEAAAAFALVHGPAPTPAQWAELRRDLAALPAGAVYWLRRFGRPVVLSTEPAESWPGYEGLGPANGFSRGDCAIVVDVNRGYPETPTGVARAGSSVVLHEVGHALDRYLDGTGGRSNWPLHRQGRWVEAHAAIDWSPYGKLYARYPSEAVAEAFALWCMVRAGTFADRLWQVDPLILAYWDETARQANW